MKNARLTPLMLALLATPALSATEELIITGSYSPVTNEQLSSSVSVINKAQLLLLSNHSLIDALRQVPSLWVEEQGGPGGVTSINLRGSEANHTLVLLDGVQLNDPTNTRGGAFDLKGINIESIERIEIIRGAQSAIYGSDALAGVIHIITQTPGKQSTTLNASIGEEGYASTGVAASGTLGQVGYAFNIQTTDAGEPVRGSTAENKEFAGRLNWQQEDHTLNFSYRYFDGERTSFPEQSGGPEYAQQPDLDEAEYTDKSAALSWTMQVNNFWQSKTTASWYQRDENQTSPGILPYDAVPPNGAVIDFERTQFSWINTLGDQQKMWANIGVETKREDGISQGYLFAPDVFPLNFALDREINSAFINVNTYVVDDWLVQASLRRDDADNVSANDSGHIGTRYKINDNISWFANWGQGFKLPSFFALGHPFVGNPDLLEETVTTMDTGIEYTRDLSSARFSVFNHKYKNLIDYDGENNTNVNRAPVKTQGVEAELNWQLLQNLQWRLHGSYADIDMPSSETHLLGRPQSSYGSALNYTLDDAWSFNVNYLRVDERFAVSRYTGVGMEEILNAYNRIDANARWNINANTQLGLTLENLAEETYYTDIGFPTAGRMAKLNLRLSF
ncbi:MAG: TonB-dependent receptor [Cellvibrio sp.]|uniref:TonB-dependent receptor plug domain-containing protein n=1 Tax=Cellvibrio sp. TaxID=1965322 RepID=UPI00271F702F|nr:TonB-dependent receptor [Cellvibrio sp.]